jgi:hypothetical protein
MVVCMWYQPIRAPAGRGFLELAANQPESRVRPSCSRRGLMLPQLLEDSGEEARLHALPEHLHGGGVVARAQFATVQALNLGVPQEARPERGLHERTGRC